jgi:hypothetical protein
MAKGKGRSPISGGQRDRNDLHSSCRHRFCALLVDVDVALISTAITSGSSSSRMIEIRAFVAFETQPLMVVQVDGDREQA